VLRDAQSRLDCCDASTSVRPGQTAASFVFDQGTCPASWKLNDFNCDGVVRYHNGPRDLRISPVGGESCDDANGAGLACAARSSIGPIGANSPFGDLFTEDTVFDSNGDAAFCGNSSLQYQTCAVVGGVCTATFGLAPSCL
jgi:hypothetical protein